MKRLIKKSNSDNTTAKFIQDWFYNHMGVGEDLLTQVISENIDCIQTILAYRYIEIKSVNFQDYDIDNEKDLDELIQVIKQEIGHIDEYTSFSKSKEGVNNFLQAVGSGRGVIISKKINGLDVPLLTNKIIKETNDSEVLDLQEAINQEDEIISTEPVDIYDLEALVWDVTDIEWL